MTKKSDVSKIIWKSDESFRAPLSSHSEAIHGSIDRRNPNQMRSLICSEAARFYFEFFEMIFSEFRTFFSLGVERASYRIRSPRACGGFALLGGFPATPSIYIGLQGLLQYIYIFFNIIFYNLIFYI